MRQEPIFARLNNTKGSVLVTVAVLLVVLVGFMALALDVGNMMVKRNELQNVADSAALAATGRLGAIYMSMSPSEQEAYVADPSELGPTATALGTDMGLTINTSDILIGHWDTTTYTFTPGLSHPNAIQVDTRRDKSANGPVKTFFAGVLGINSVSASTSAIAALTGVCNKPQNGLPLPVGISTAWFTGNYCGQPIRLYPTNDPAGCAGWDTYEDGPSSANLLNNILKGLNNGTYESPDTTAGDTIFNFTGGTVANAFDNMLILFNTMKVKNDGVLDMDNDPNTWTLTVPVYDYPDCSNPKGSILIVGFAEITITSVQTTPAKTIDAKVVCNLVTGGSGGCTNYGLIGAIPNLVQ
jgi:hypothetical protein